MTATSGAVYGRTVLTNMSGGGKKNRGLDGPANQFGDKTGGRTRLWRLLLCAAVLFGAGQIVQGASGTGGAEGAGGADKKVALVSVPLVTGKVPQVNPISIPEPGTLILVLTGILAITSRQRKPQAS